MMAKDYWIVWNADKTEGFITEDRQLAYEVRKSSDTNCFDHNGRRSDVAIAFCEAWGDQDCTMERITVLPSEAAKKAQGGFAGLFFLAVVAAVVLFFAGTLKLAHEEAREWEAFKVEHACKQVSTVSGSTTTYTYVGAGGMPATCIAYTPGKTVWMCDDGLLRVR